MYNSHLMSDEFIKIALEDAALEYVSLMNKRSDMERQLAEIDREAHKVSLKVVTLATLCDEAPKHIAVAEVLNEVSKLGLTDAVRSVLRASGDWMTPMEIRDQVVKLGINLSKYQNPLASIHTILGRLDKEVEGAIEETSRQRAARQRGEATKPKIIFRWRGRVETLWDRLANLPRDKADKVMKETAEGISKKQMDKLWTTKKSKKR